MKKATALVLIVLMMISTTISAAALHSDIAPSGITVVERGDWMLKKVNKDTQWELNDYLGESTDIITPRFIDGLAVVAYGDHCFANDTSIKRIVTSSPLRTIGDYAFIDCTALEYFELNYALDRIGAGAFYGTVALKGINLQESVVTEIQAYSFMNSGLETVEFPATCTKIGAFSFAQCSSLTKVIIPDSVNEIAVTAFDGSDNVVIYAPKDSYAIEYAQANDIDYVIVDPDATIVTFILGDADDDGAVTILDATRVQRILADLYDDEDGMSSLRGNVSGDDLDILDATKIQRFLAGMEVDAPVNTSVTVVL